MTIRIEERFAVKAPLAPVWDYLIDPRRVVPCVPGGVLDEVVDERTFHGSVRVKIGALVMAYGGRVRLAEVDVAARRVKIVGEARERAGAGSARLTLESWLAALPDGGTEVVAQAQVDVGGQILQLGSGIIQQMAHEVFQQFAACVRATLEAEESARAAATVGAPRMATAPPRHEPLRPVPLLFRAVRAWLAGLFRPRAGSGPRT